MNKEEIKIKEFDKQQLENLLDNYENAIYGKAFPITPSTHQLHLLLDYIANLEQQCKKQKEVIDKVINNSQYWIDYYTKLNSDERIALRLQENIDILKEVK